MDDYVTGRELARQLNISETMIRKHRATGLLIQQRAGAHKGKYHLEQSMAAFRVNRDPDAALKGIAGGAASRGEAAPLPESSLTKVRTIHAGLRAQREKLELEQRRGELINKADARAAILAVVTVVTERMDGAAAMIAPRVAGMTNPAEIERVARDVLNAVRAEIAGMAQLIEVVANAKR